eukprot:gene11052-3122_t
MGGETRSREEEGTEESMDSVARSLGLLVAQSLGLSVARSLGLSVSRSLSRSVSRSLLITTGSAAEGRQLDHSLHLFHHHLCALQATLLQKVSSSSSSSCSCSCSSSFPLPSLARFLVRISPGIMSKYLPPYILSLFKPRPLLEQISEDYLPIEPCDRKYHRSLTGISSYVHLFENKTTSRGPRPPSNKEERKAEKRRLAEERNREYLEAAKRAWDPEKDPNAAGDAYKTLFVGRLDYKTTEEDLQREMQGFGKVRQISIVRDQVTGKPRGYAFVEFEHERDMRAAYRYADGVKIHSRRIVVDFERGRTVDGWYPRRLGGGLGGTRIGGPDQNIKASGRYDPERHRRIEQSSRGERGSRRSRSRSRGRGRDRDRSRSRSRDRGRDRDSERSRDRHSSRDRRERRSSRYDRSSDSLSCFKSEEYLSPKDDFQVSWWISGRRPMVSASVRAGALAAVYISQRLPLARRFVEVIGTEKQRTSLCVKEPTKCLTDTTSNFYNLPDFYLLIITNCYHALEAACPTKMPGLREKPCLKCNKCSRTLANGSFLEHEGKPYCEKPCYQALFGAKGFGRGGTESHQEFGSDDSKLIS